MALCKQAVNRRSDPMSCGLYGHVHLILHDNNGGWKINNLILSV